MSGILDNASSSAQASKLVSLLQPSSVAAERVFTFIKLFLWETKHFLQDYVCLFACLMLAMLQFKK